MELFEEKNAAESEYGACNGREYDISPSKAI